MKRSEMVKKLMWPVITLGQGSLTKKEATEKAEYILSMLEAAGMQPPKTHKIDDTGLNGYMTNQWDKE